MIAVRRALAIRQVTKGAQTVKPSRRMAMSPDRRPRPRPRQERPQEARRDQQDAEQDEDPLRRHGGSTIQETAQFP